MCFSRMAPIAYKASIVASAFSYKAKGVRVWKNSQALNTMSKCCLLNKLGDALGIWGCDVCRTTSWFFNFENGYLRKHNAGIIAMIAPE